MKKVVLKLEIYDEKTKQKAMGVVSGLSGIVSISFDSKDNNLTVTGDIDAVVAVHKLRKICHTEVVSVGPVKEPEKKKEEPKKTEEKKKVDPPREQFYYYCPPYNPPMPPYPYPYQVRCVEEDQSSCVIC